MPKIFLDAGHGGIDGGAAANGIKEKDIVLKLVKKMQAMLKNYEDAEVILSRSSDVGMSLEERTRKANLANADVLVSVHVNAAAATSARGFESFIYPNAGSATTAFQNVMHQEIIRAMGSSITNRGQKNANFHMLRESKMKSVLTENLFISNGADAKLLKDDNFLDKIAQGHINGLEKFLGLKRKEQQEEQPADDGKLWKVQVGAYNSKSNAEAMAADLRKLGYKPFIKYE